MTPDYQRIAAMITECDDPAELAEVLAEVYRMLPPAQQASFQAAITPKPAIDLQAIRQAQGEQMAAAAENLRQRTEAAQERQRQLEAAVYGPERSPEETTALRERQEQPTTTITHPDGTVEKLRIVLAEPEKLDPQDEERRARAHAMAERARENARRREAAEREGRTDG